MAYFKKKVQNVVLLEEKKKGNILLIRLVGLYCLSKSKWTFVIKLALNSGNSSGLTHSIGVYFDCFDCPDCPERSLEVQLKWLEILENVGIAGH